LSSWKTLDKGFAAAQDLFRRRRTLYPPVMQSFPIPQAKGEPAGTREEEKHDSRVDPQHTTDIATAASFRT
jgi:hypothetical protein